MNSQRKGPSEKLKRKLLARWQWLAARGVETETAARELGVTVGDLLGWMRALDVGAPLIVPVQIEDAPTERRALVVVLDGGIRVEGLTLDEVVELARRLP